MALTIRTASAMPLTDASEHNILTEIPNLTDNVSTVFASDIMDTMYTALTAYNKAVAVETSATNGEFDGVSVTDITAGTATTSGNTTTTPITFTLSDSTSKTVYVSAQKGDAGISPTFSYNSATATLTITSA